MSDKDEKIRQEVLKWLYARFETDPNGRCEGEPLFEDLERFDRNEITYNIERMDGDTIDKKGSIGSKVSLINITAGGIEELHERGFTTILQSQTRYDILEVLYEADREDPNLGYVDRTELEKDLESSIHEIDKNIWYLKEKRMVETMYGGGSFYSNAKITDRGSNAYEAYRDDKVTIPHTGAVSSLHQETIGPGESQKAENMFRDPTELAEEEIIIIDPWARKPIYDMLENVPDGVKIRILTTENVVSQEQNYEDRIQSFQKTHSDIEVRCLEKRGEWDFHDRYIIRDGKTGYAWGHSFHDAGETQHTASELKPVNRDNTLDKFKNSWKEGELVN